jgi:hypothetical protein
MKEIFLKHMSSTVGIFLHGQQGDIMSAMSVLKYRQQLWGNARIVWYADRNNFDLFKYQDIEVREFPRGFGYPEMVVEENRKLVEAGKEPIWEDWEPLVDWNNHVNVALKNNYPSLADINFGYFPAPHQMKVTERHGLSYPDCSKKVFSVPMEWEWHPVIAWSDEEIAEVEKFINPAKYQKRIFFETFAGSDQSKITKENVEVAVKLCKEMWPGCAIIFSSHKFLRAQENFPDGWFDQEDVLSAAKFTVRQCGILNNFVDLIISVSSGTTVACSAWGNKPTAIIQLCGSFICSTKSLASDRHFELVTTDNKTPDQWSKEFYNTLSDLLNIYR